MKYVYVAFSETDYPDHEFEEHAAYDDENEASKHAMWLLGQDPDRIHGTRRLEVRKKFEGHHGRP